MAVSELLHVKQTKNWVMNVYRGGTHIAVFRMVNVHLSLDSYTISDQRYTISWCMTVWRKFGFKMLCVMEGLLINKINKYLIISK